MDINIKGDPGTGNTFQEIHIGTVQNYNPNATTVINNNYADPPKPAPATERILQDAEREQIKAQILDYVARLKQCVVKEWKNRYDTLWKHILAIAEVEAVVFNPGKQKNATFNRNLVANIIFIMCEQKVMADTTATKLTELLEGDKDHSVRAQLGLPPADATICSNVEKLIANA